MLGNSFCNGKAKQRVENELPWLVTVTHHHTDTPIFSFMGMTDILGCVLGRSGNSQLPSMQVPAASTDKGHLLQTLGSDSPM